MLGMVTMLKVWFDTCEGILMKKTDKGVRAKPPPAFQAAFPAIGNVYTALPASFFAPYPFSWILVRNTVLKDATAIEEDYMAPLLSTLM